MKDNRYIVIFDGVCNFCNGSVNFIIERDPTAKFSFTPVQSDFAQELIAKHGVDRVGVDTFLLIKDDRCFAYTDAALEIAKDLSKPWPVFTVFKIVPGFVRDSIYKAFARNRYSLFGKSAMCMVPTPEVRSRFIGIKELPEK